ncbi:MAG: phenylalanine--tRNA ligase subunit beta [Oscillospiraceae bacterium]|nr:phenylalanine--tRNA ligase subunit beta [Oscillospiraceae bacterium]
MLLPLSWLNEYVDTSAIPVEELQARLFSAGFEVEEIVYPGAEISGCVVGKITEITQHPDADKLVICQVDCGPSGQFQVVTGATNVKTGHFVPVALDGATLCGGVKITSGQLRGQVSQGMLCSGEELGIDDDWYDGAGVHGILIFGPEVTTPGVDAKALLGLDDCVMDISVTANRPDCQCVYGMAREVAAAFSLPLRELELDYKTTGGPSDLKVSVQDSELCPRYIGRQVRRVKIGPSPVEMRRKLRLCGHGVHSNVVDVTNYILLELGQPMHAFDASKVAGGEIVVRRATAGEKIITLDERDHTLTTENLLICDGSKPKALAGVMGGLESGIADNTAEIIFESAVFEKANIRRTSRSLGQSSDASKRYEKGLDDHTPALALERALHLMDKYGFGAVSESSVDVWANPDKVNPTIRTTIAKINAVLGIEVPATTMREILERLNFVVTLSDDEITATPPFYREDIEEFPCLAEEVIRIYGFEHLTPTMMDEAAITPGGLSEQQLVREKLCIATMSQGFCETIHYSFHSPRDLDMLGLPAGARARDTVAIENPISENYTIMRRTLVPSILKTIARNCKRGVNAGRLYELANEYIPRPGESLPEEVPMLCLGLFGEGEDYLSAKGALEQICDTLGVALTYEKANFDSDEAPTYLHPGRAAALRLNGEVIGYLGQLAYPVQQNFEIARPVFIAQLDARVLLGASPARARFSPLPAHLEVERDLALVADEALTNGEIEAAITGACGQVSRVRLFDIYRSEQLGEGKKSMAYTLTFTPGDSALTGEQVDGFVGEILAALEKLGAKIRG